MHNKIKDKYRVLHIKEDIKGMSHESITQYAEDNPIIPLEDTKHVMSENAGYAGAIQTYCTVINTQPDVQLDDIPSIICSQELAREHANDWLNTLNPDIKDTYTQVKQFCNFYGSLDDKDIDDLVNNINNPSGKKAFIQAMEGFQTDCDKRGKHSDKVSNNLVGFNLDLAVDLRNFLRIKQEADILYFSENAKIQQLEEDMVYYSEKVDEYNVAIAATSASLNQKIPVIFLFFFSFGSLLLILGSTKARATQIAELNELTKAQKQAQESYEQAASELVIIQKQCAVLEALSDNFNSLGKQNEEASFAVLQMVMTWQLIGLNFNNLSYLAGDVVNQELQWLIKLQLKAALQDVKELKTFAEQCEENGVLPVEMDAELIYRLRLPQSWFNQVIDGNTFRGYVAAKRKKGFFDRGRSGWRTRDRQIYIPLYQTRC